MQEYTGLKAVYFNSNAISRIEGLDKCTQLRCLYLEQNLLDEVRAQLTTAVQRQITDGLPAGPHVQKIMPSPCTSGLSL